MLIAADSPPLRVDEFGIVRVGTTRVSLDLVVFAFSEGASAQEIVERYPSLDLAEVHGAICYYLRHRNEVDDYLRDQEAVSEHIRRENEARWPPKELRDRLLARRSGQPSQ